MSNASVAVDLELGDSSCKAAIRLKGGLWSGRRLDELAASLLTALARCDGAFTIERDESQRLGQWQTADGRLQPLAESGDAAQIVSILRRALPTVRFIVRGAQAVGIVAEPEGHEFDFDVEAESLDDVRRAVTRTLRWSAEHDVSVGRGWFVPVSQPLQ